MPQINLRIRLITIICAMGVFLSGCVFRKTIVPQSQRLLPAESRTFNELLHSLESGSRAVRTVKAAKVLFQPSGGAIKKGEVTETRVPIGGFILIERPQEIRIRLNIPLFGTTGADLVSDGQNFEVWVPLTNKVYEGRSDQAIQISSADLELPPPADISAALFVDISQYLNNPKYRLFPKEVTLGTHRYYVIGIVQLEDTESGNNARLVQEVWIDRTNMEITQQFIFGNDGQVVTNAEFSGYRLEQNGAFPRVLTIHRPIEDVNLKITFQTPPDLNGALPSNAFQLDFSGAQVIQLPGEQRKP